MWHPTPFQLLELGLQVIPLSDKTKRPSVLWAHYHQGEGEHVTKAEVESWIEKHRSCAIMTNQFTGLVVVDCDSPEALAYAEAHCPPTPLVVLTGIKDEDTGWRGRHLYYRMPPEAVRNTTRLNGYKLDVRGVGGYVVAPGSPHKSGVTYEATEMWTRNLIDSAPIYDLTWWPIVEDVRTSVGPALTETLCDLSAYERGRAWIAKRDPAIEGQGGDTHTFATACHLAELGCSETEIFDLLGTWNATCVPPWSERDLEDKARRAFRKTLKKKPEPVHRRAVDAAKREEERERDLASLDETEPRQRTSRTGEQPEGGGSDAGTGDGDSPPELESGREPGPEVSSENPILPIEDGRFAVFLDGGNLNRQMVNLASALEMLPESIFYRRSSLLVNVCTHDHRLLDTDLGAIECEVAAHVQFRKWKKSDGVWGISDCNMPSNLISALRSRPRFFGVPEVKYITVSPIVLPSGEITTKPGFYPEHGVFYTGKHRCASIPKNPTQKQIEKAVEELRFPFCEFPFVDESGFANLLAMMLGLVARLLFEMVPPFLFAANSPGTGKGLAMSCAFIMATGEDVPISTWDPNEAEQRKNVTSILKECTRVVLYDNINEHLNSGVFCAVATAKRWRDRVLGSSQTIDVENLTVFVVSSNNPSATTEVIRRFEIVDMVSNSENPASQKKKWKVSLPSYCEENTPRLMAALLTLWRAWFCAGKPLGDETHPSFDDFAKKIGGVLSVAGVTGYLENAERLREEADPEIATWRGFVSAWAAQYQLAPVTASQLRALCVYHDPELCNGERADRLLPEVLGAGNERSQNSRLGIALSSMRNRIFGIHRIVKLADKLGGKNAQYRLEPVRDTVTQILAGSKSPEGPEVRRATKKDRNGAISDFRTFSGPLSEVRKERREL